MKYIIFILLTVSLFATEEKSKYPFFYLKPLRLNLDLNPELVKVCRIVSKDVLKYRKLSLKNCYKPGYSFKGVLDSALKDYPDKKELVFKIVDTLDKPVEIEIEIDENKFSLMGFVYMQKEQTFHIELKDKKGNFFFYTSEPMLVHLIANSEEGSKEDTEPIQIEKKKEEELE